MNALKRLFLRFLTKNQNVSRISMRLAIKEDFEFIFDLCVKEAQAGHFNPTYAIPIPQIQGGLMKQIASAINDSPYPMEPGNKRNGVGARIVVLMLNNNRVGFALLLEDSVNSWYKNVEFHLFAISNEYREQGLGTCFVKYILNSLNTQPVIYARCYQQSTIMIKMLKKAGFVEVISKGKNIRLELRR